MKKLLIILFLLPFVSSAQKTTYSADVEYRNQGVIGSGFGAGFGMEFEVTDMVSMGFGFSGVKFENLKQVYYPLLGNVVVKIPSSGRIKPKLGLEAGYGIYSYTNNVSSADRYTIKGGLTSSGGVIVAVLAKKQVSPYIFLGYTMSMFRSKHITMFGSSVNTTESTDRYGGVLVRLGINF
jgi:hypothetical protein